MSSKAYSETNGNAKRGLIKQEEFELPVESNAKLKAAHSISICINSVDEVSEVFV